MEKERPEEEFRRKPKIPAQEGRYANYFQVGYNAFEFLLEFGQRGRIHTAVYMSPQHARLFRDVLQNALAEFDAQSAPQPPERTR